jgi:trigger factor
MVDAEYQRFLQRYAQEIPKPEGAVAELGDLVTADLQFEKDGVILNTVRERKLQVLPTLQFTDGVIPDFGACLVGARIGDVREATAQIRSSSRDAALRGQSVRVFIKLLDLKSQRLPEVNAAFLALHGFDDVEHLRAEIRRMLERRRTYQQQRAVRQAILEPLLKQTPIELPAELVARQEKSTLQSLVHQLRQSGLSENEIRAQEVQIRANAHEATLRSLRELFLLARIAEAENIALDPEDLEQEILEIAERTGETPRRVRARLEKDGLVDALATQIIERKSIERILTYAQIENVPLVPPQEEPIETLEEATAAPPESEEGTAAEDQEAAGGSSET